MYTSRGEFDVFGRKKMMSRMGRKFSIAQLSTELVKKPKVCNVLPLIPKHIVLTLNFVCLVVQTSLKIRNNLPLSI